jgi:hypothetical protein
MPQQSGSGAVVHRGQYPDRLLVEEAIRQGYTARDPEQRRLPSEIVGDVTRPDPTCPRCLSVSDATFHCFADWLQTDALPLRGWRATRHSVGGLVRYQAQLTSRQVGRPQPVCW